MLARDWMTTDPVVAKPAETLAEAVHRMASHDVRHLPVVQGTRVVGVLSERDALGPPLGAPGDDASELGERVANRAAAEFVRDLMATPPITIASDGGIPRACVEFVSRAIGCLPVVDDGQLVGLLTTIDAMRAYLSVTGSAEGLRAEEWEARDPLVAQVMSSEVVTVAPATTVAEAALVCHREGVRHLPVVDGEKLAAVLSERDLRSALAEERGDEPALECATPSPLRTAPIDRLSTATAVLVEQRIGALPVVDGDTLVGILSASDVLGHAIEALRAVKSAS